MIDHLFATLLDDTFYSKITLEYLNSTRPICLIISQIEMIDEIDLRLPVSYSKKIYGIKVVYAWQKLHY